MNDKDEYIVQLEKEVLMYRESYKILIKSIYMLLEPELKRRKINE